VFINYLYGLSENLKDRKVNEANVSIKLLETINKYCKQHNITMVINGIHDEPITKQAINEWRKIGILVNDISVDFTKQEFNLMPYDGHPNEKANRMYADLTIQFLSEKIMF